MAIYRSKDDFYGVTFVLTAYSSLLLLFWCLRSIERAGPNAPHRARLKACVWFLCTLLTAMFSYKVVAIMPWPVDLVMWGLASSVVIAAAAAGNLQPSKLPSQEHTNVHRVDQYFNHSNFFPFFAFLFLTYNAVMSVYRSWHSPWDLAFVISCYTKLILLFWCLKLRENLGADAPREKTNWLKLVVFVLMTLLTVTFAYRVSLIMPLSLKIVVWAMSGSVIAAGFYAFFIFDRDVKEANNGYCKLDDVEENENWMILRRRFNNLLE